MMDIIIARHGNTFEPGEKVTWVGAGTDLPLAAKGQEQAYALGLALRAKNRVPNLILAAPLQRTRDFAGIVARAAGVRDLVMDARLKEIDYGPLENLTTEEIATRVPGAEAMLENWGKKDIWPENLGWASSEAEMTAALQGFAKDYLVYSETARPLIVSSNGAIRFLARALSLTPLEGMGFKLATGALGLVRQERGSIPFVQKWNVKPGDIS